MYLFSFPKPLRLLTEAWLFVNGAVSVLAMFSDDGDTLAGAGLAGTGLAVTGSAGAGLAGTGTPDAAEPAILVFVSAETHCNAKANTIAISTNVFLARLSIFFQLITQNVLCSSKLTNVNLFTVTVGM